MFIILIIFESDLLMVNPYFPAASSIIGSRCLTSLFGKGRGETTYIYSLISLLTNNQNDTFTS